MCNFCKDNDFFQTGFANTSANTLLAEMKKDSQDVQIMFTLFRKINLLL